MEDKKITTETAKTQLLPVLQYRKRKDMLPFFEISVSTAIPTLRTIDCICDRTLKLEEGEVALLYPNPKLGCVITPNMLTPEMEEFEELKITMFNMSNATIRVNPGEPAIGIKLLSFGKKKKGDDK